MENSSFSFLFDQINDKSLRNLVVANGVDDHSLEAVAEAARLRIVKVILTGNAAEIETTCQKLNFPEGSYQIINCKSETEALSKAVQLAKNGEANLIMKGLVSTDQFMRAILNKETGILPKGKLLTHVTLVKNANYHKPLLVSDVAIIPLPTLEQKIKITEYLIEISHKLGIEKPKIAFVAATEKAIDKMPACADAVKLSEHWKNNGFKSSVCDGPMALDVAIDAESAEIKKYVSEVAGDADCLLFPNIESGNVFYKMNTKLCNAQTAAIVVGTNVPTVLSSRGDTTQTKLNSIALAAMIG